MAHGSRARSRSMKLSEILKGQPKPMRSSMGGVVGWVSGRMTSEMNRIRELRAACRIVLLSGSISSAARELLLDLGEARHQSADVQNRQISRVDLLLVLHYIPSKIRFHLVVIVIIVSFLLWHKGDAQQSHPPHQREYSQEIVERRVGHEVVVPAPR